MSFVLQVLKELAGVASQLFKYYSKPTTYEDITKDVPSHIKSKLDKLENMDDTKISSTQKLHTGPDGKYTKDRQKLHMSIVKSILTPDVIKNAKPKPGTRPVAHFLGGRPGSGKSFFTSGPKPLINTKNSLVVNPDDVKAKLPEYKGDNAAQVHEESSDITSLVSRNARKHGLNLVYDATMSSYPKLKNKIQDLQKSGYDVHGHYMFTPPHISAKRSIDRFVKTGRHVPIKHILDSTENESSFDANIHNFKKWDVYENMGDSPKLVARSHSNLGHK